MDNKRVYTIKPKDFKMLERMADNVYNTAVVVDHYCKTQLEIEELYHLAPVEKTYAEMPTKSLHFLSTIRKVLIKGG